MNRLNQAIGAIAYRITCKDFCSWLIIEVANTLLFMFAIYVIMGDIKLSLHARIEMSIVILMIITVLYLMAYINQNLKNFVSRLSKKVKNFFVLLGFAILLISLSEYFDLRVIHISFVFFAFASLLHFGEEFLILQIAEVSKENVIIATTLQRIFVWIWMVISVVWIVYFYAHYWSMMFPS